MSGRPDADVVRRFAVEHHPVRGQFARLGASWLALREHGAYPAPVRTLLGEATSAAVLLASTLKFEGLLTLQMQGSGAVRLLVAQCTHDFRVRAVARFDAARLAEDFASLAGEGQIAVTVESDRLASRYQGIVPIDGGSFEASIEHYFDTSEQLPTVVRLAADDAGASGMLLQRMPAHGGHAAADDAAARRAQEAEAQRTWERARDALAGIGADELLFRPAPELMQRALAGEDLRIFESQTVSFECRCSNSRVAGMLRSLGEAETRDILREQGVVTVTCEFCHRPYRFDAVDVDRLFGSAEARPPGSGSVN